LDLNALAELERDVDAGIFVDLINQFLDESRARLQRIAGFVDDADFDGIENETHALSSSAATFGARLVSEQAKTIERACLKGDRSLATALAKTLPEIAESAFDALSARIRGAG
jgi:HPt (histidine-containing phosphotransfer) domain-containing protein